MKLAMRQHTYELIFFLFLTIGLVALAQAQQSDNTRPEDESVKKRVRVEVEITENGKTSTSIQELDLDKESINGQLDEMVEEIEMILEEAVQDVEETDLEITIRRNSFGTPPRPGQPHVRRHISVIPEAPSLWDYESEPMAFLGVYAVPLDQEELEELNLDEGVVIERVVENSSADQAGLREGDVVYEIDSEEVETFGVLSRIIKSHEPGESVNIKLYRNGQPMELNATLGESERREYLFRSDNRGFLGVKGRDDQGGALIETIIDGSAAERSELKPSDVIVGVDGQAINGFDELGQAIQSKNTGESVSIDIIRDDQKQTIEVELGSKTEGYDIIWNAKDPQYNYDFDFNYEEDDRAFLGIVGKTSDNGVKISRIFDGSTADKMGLEKGDLITALDGNKIEDVGELVEHLNGMEKGDELKVTFKRDGKKMKETGQLGSRANHVEDLRMSQSEVKRIVMHVDVEELDEAEIRDLSKKSGEPLDESNSLVLNEMRFSPNPNNGQFKLYFDLPETGDTEIRVFDQNGKTIEVAVLKGFSGIYSNQFDISDVPAGIYFVSITQNGQGMTSKIVKQ